MTDTPAAPPPHSFRPIPTAELLGSSSFAELADEIILFRDDFDRFKNWINLNIDSVTWQGIYLQDFDEFWQFFFLDGLSFVQMLARFDHAYQLTLIGPLASWFTWLKEHFICFCFITKDLSVDQISWVSKMHIAQVATILRNFFCEEFPHLEETFNHTFQIHSRAFSNAHVKFKDLDPEIQLAQDLQGGLQDRTMQGLEITLYREWKELTAKLKKELFGSGQTLILQQERLNGGPYLKVIRDIVLLLLLAILGGYALTLMNRSYEKYLADKIKIFEPTFFQTAKRLQFKGANARAAQDLIASVPIKDIEDIRVLQASDPVPIETEQFTPESDDVIISSLDKVPKNISSADLERSAYEEEEKGGFRDTTAGTRKVYRVMMRSVDALAAKQKLDSILIKYHVEQQDNVRPGSAIPGGLYYNLVVPIDFINEFLAEVMAVDEAILFENKSGSAAPPGKKKVLIWIKSG